MSTSQQLPDFSTQTMRQTVEAEELAVANSAMTTKWKDGKEMSEYYNKWAEYDDSMKGRYGGPEQCADLVVKYCAGEKAEVEVLDVAAGTGLVGQQLQERGYRLVDGIEPTPGMVERAREKGLYRHIYEDFFTHNTSCIPTDSYDVLVMVGALGEGHFPVNALPELVRVVRPGGLLFILGRHELLHLEVYKDKLEEAMSQLEEAGSWQQVERAVTPGFFQEHDGIVFIYKVTK